MKGLKNSDLNRVLNPDLCDTGAVLHQLSYQTNWEQVVVGRLQAHRCRDR